MTNALAKNCLRSPIDSKTILAGSELSGSIAHPETCILLSALGCNGSEWGDRSPHIGFGVGQDACTNGI